MIGKHVLNQIYVSVMCSCFGVCLYLLSALVLMNVSLAHPGEVAFYPSRLCRPDVEEYHRGLPTELRARPIRSAERDEDRRGVA